MTNYYGIGSWWKKKPHQQFYNFIKKDKACIHASLDKPTQREISNREEFRRIFKTINEGDIIYLKSFKIKGHKVRIRAVGKVTSIDKTNENNNIFCVNVDYNKNYGFNGIIEDIIIDDNFQRNKRIYQETNQKIIQIVNELLKE